MSNLVNLSYSEIHKSPDHATRVIENPIEAQEIVRRQAVWRLRNSERKTRMFRLRRAGELAMSTTVASLGIYGVAQSLSEGRFESTAISAIGILWSAWVGSEAVKDFNSPYYTDLVTSTVRERMHHDATMASLEVEPE